MYHFKIPAFQIAIQYRCNPAIPRLDDFSLLNIILSVFIKPFPLFKQKCPPTFFFFVYFCFLSFHPVFLFFLPLFLYFDFYVYFIRYLIGATWRKGSTSFHQLPYDSGALTIIDKCMTYYKLNGICLCTGVDKWHFISDLILESMNWLPSVHTFNLHISVWWFPCILAELDVRCSHDKVLAVSTGGPPPPLLHFHSHTVP